MKAPEFIIMFLILLTTCSTYYLHWYHNNDHETYTISHTVPMRPVLRAKEASIVVAVPTHNRIGYVQLTSAALKGTFPDDDVWVFDDTSTEYSEQDLIEWYGTKHVFQSKKRLKADAMARHILEWFLESEYDVLVLLDSDLLVSPNWLPKLRDGLRESTGLLSLYRSGAPKHKSVQCGDVLCLQPSMGNAGTVWRRALVQRMLSEMPARNGGFDWGWSEWCTKNKVPMEALKNSAVLHIGMHGSWSHETSAEKSVGFPMKELSEGIRNKAEQFLKGVKPVLTRPILWVIPAFKRAWSLDLVLKSLSVHEATKILVSKDADSADIDSVLSKYSVDVIEHPWSCSRHPHQFPAKDELLNKNYKGDTYGNPRSPWATCLKHHWWWMMKQAWARKPERVCVLEDDTVIHRQAFVWLARQSGNVKLTPDEIAVPWCMSTKEWQAIDPKKFCEHDDYNWDQTIAWMMKEHGPNEAVVPSESLSMHVGDCGGWDAGGRAVKCTSEQIANIRANVEQWLGKPVAVNTIKKKWLTAHSKPNGGWGHPKDHEHCLEVARESLEIKLSTARILSMSAIGFSTYQKVTLESNLTGLLKMNLWCAGMEEILAYKVDKLFHFNKSPTCSSRIFKKNEVPHMAGLFQKEPYITYLKSHNFLQGLMVEFVEHYESVLPGMLCYSPEACAQDKRCPFEVESVTELTIYDYLIGNNDRIGNCFVLPGSKEPLRLDQGASHLHELQWEYPSTALDYPRVKRVYVRDILSENNFNEHICSAKDTVYGQRILELSDEDNIGTLVRDITLNIPSFNQPGTQAYAWVNDEQAQRAFNDVLTSRVRKLSTYWNSRCSGTVYANQPPIEHTYEHKDKISIHILTTGDRDIHHLKQKIPNAHIFRGSVGYDESCKNILVDIGAQFKKYYYGTLDYIEEGKLGHWCSNLRFAQDCNGLCVLIEDDIMLNAKDVTILQETLQHPWTTPVLALGPSGDTINVWNGSATKRVFEIVREGINQPMDLFFNSHGIYTKRGPIGTLVDTSNSAKTSIIRSMLTPIKLIDINEQIDSAKQKSEPTINTLDLFAAIDYNAPENSGPWKQGWDYDYDGRFKDGLTVHVVPHSHNDPGWIQTYHTYYSTQTRHILDTVVVALTEDPRRTFIWAEISYFSLWWDDASPQQKEQAKQLVAEKRLDFVTGGWVMNDEASVTARATRWHLQEGREWLQKTFGITPQYSWAIDPFGHSAGQAQVLKELGYKGMLIQRVHYAVKKQLAQKQQLEFQWQTPAGEIFTHMMPFYSYDGPHTCGPDPSVCCQFDFARINGGYSGCPWHKPAVPITTANVAERSKSWLDQVYKKAMLYRGKKVLIPIGDDFRYQTMDEAHKQFENYQKMFDWIGVHLPSVKVSFSTLTRYFDAAVQTHVPKLQGSFFPYSDRMQDYWTGYFNSRIFYKGYDRLLESLIAAVERICPDEDVHMQKRTLGLFQHHDGITGTAKSLVVQDYYQTMQKAVSELETMLRLNFGSHVIVNPLDQATPTMAPNEIKSWQTAQLCQTIDEMVPQMTVDGHGMITALASQAFHETLVWRSNKPGHGVAGAYLMAVTGQEDVLKPIKHSVCGTSLYTELQTVFEMVTRRARVYKDGTVEILYDVDIHARNNGELWAVYKPEWSAEHLCSDLHGLTWECHVERKDAPLQSKFWPMPTMAWLASASKRMTWTGAQPTGVGLHDGAMVLMLDRRGNKDDARGLGQGITDSRPVMMRFGVVMETEGLKERASEKALSIRNWMLNPEIELV